MEIKEIIIRGTSGFCHVDEAYEDELVLTETSISYEYIPHPMSRLETNIYRKWAYDATNSPEFKSLYSQVTEMTPKYLNDIDKDFVTDVGPIIITAKYEDDYSQTADFYCDNEFFEEYFSIIKKMIPEFECMPTMLVLAEDFKE